MSEGKVQIQADRLKELMRDMVDIYSPSGKEGEIGEYLAGYLLDKGLPVTLREVSEGRRNVEVVFSDKRPEIAFIGHIDTVPAYDIENYEFDEEDGLIYGLGTADMKGGCAAMVEAFVAAVEAGMKPERAGLFLVVGEEETSDGTAALLEARSFPWAIIGEPTNLVPCLAHYGYMEMLVRVFGTRRHAATAGREYNAIFSTLRMLLRLGGIIEAEHPEAILNIRDIHSSEAGFAVPGSCEAWVDLHIPPAANPKQFASELEKIVRESLTGGSVTDYEIDFPLLAKGSRASGAGLVPEVLEKAYAGEGMEWHPGAFKSHSDANLLCEAQCETVIIGPGQLEKAHTRDESISFEQVEKAARIYGGVLERL
ncbi:Acetylornithine deacetylase [Anaerohalosphaera lusitana]|uniref:Acetylornithine deacetylase n=1 Tax=Anaerohalosphaera lusitana TaxID=1936003 RepID=A0A1U9NJF2_9BACT|nr:M20/M25/M40 family metallo-hydrolase [Anaerohalosphaera lusitana]AQT67646.1 Acetylornithine deacetylase [Anaerohalosphaera lusitana]